MLRPVVYTPEGQCYGTYETNHSGCGQPPAEVHICFDKLVERDRAVLVLQTTRNLKGKWAKTWEAHFKRPGFLTKSLLYKACRQLA